MKLFKGHNYYYYREEESIDCYYILIPLNLITSTFNHSFRLDM